MAVEQLQMEVQDSGEEVTELEGGKMPREKWGNKTEFILACMGYCIGIGNVWRFPYLCYRNGGGAFLIPYLIMLFLCGLPLYFMEIALGQFSSQGCITVFRISPLFKGCGAAMVVVNFMCSCYYNIVLAYPLYFMFLSFRSPLPWENCDNPWNTPACFKHGAGVHPPENSTMKLKTPADEFFHNGMLRISEGIGTPGSIVPEILAANIVSWIVIFACILNGVKSVGKVVYFTATFPYIIIIIFLVRGATLPGAGIGATFFIKPEWNHLLNLKVWADAAVQIFFALGPGWGGILNMASYNDFRNNMRFESVFIPILNFVTSLLAGFVVFTTLGYMSYITKLPISEVATEGAGLAFVIYPEAISLMPFPQFWSFTFFFMLFLLGMDSLFVQIEAVIGSLVDQFPELRQYKKYVTLVSVVVMFSVSLSMCTNGGMYVLQLLDAYSCSVAVILICTVETFIVGWLYGINNFKRDVEFMIRKRVQIFWTFCLKYITMFLLVFIFIMTLIFYTRVSYNRIEYPDWAIAVGWLTAVSSMMWIPIYMVYFLWKTPGTLREKWQKTSRPSEKWGPVHPDIKEEWLKLKEGQTPQQESR